MGILNDITSLSPHVTGEDIKRTKKLVQYSNIEWNLQQYPSLGNNLRCKLEKKEMSKRQTLPCTA